MYLSTLSSLFNVVFKYSLGSSDFSHCDRGLVLCRWRNFLLWLPRVGFKIFLFWHQCCCYWAVHWLGLCGIGIEVGRLCGIGLILLFVQSGGLWWQTWGQREGLLAPWVVLVFIQFEPWCHVESGSEWGLAESFSVWFGLHGVEMILGGKRSEHMLCQL
jgi:hypothetical protein